MKMKESKRKADAVLVLLLFGVFAVCILAVLLTGADAYRRLAERDEVSYDRRVSGQYLTTRVRQADEAGKISVETFDSVDALVLLEEFDGIEYETRVYCYEGYLRELFAEAGSEFLPDDGEPILEAQDLMIRREGQNLYFVLTDPNGAVQELTLHLRSREGGAE